MMNPQGTSAPADDGHPLYARVRQLGQGSYGGVWLAHRRSNGAQVALKYIEYVDVNEDSKITIMREICNHIKVVHPHIVVLKHITLHGTAIVLELEALEGGDLCQYMQTRYQGRGMPENVARWYFQQIVLAVDYCHGKLLCNRDLKLENVVLGKPVVRSDGNLQDPKAKLCDFGWSKDEGEDSAPHTQVGSPAYVAPEILAGCGTEKYEGAAADAWSLGIILYCLLVGYYPFRKEEDSRLNNVGRLQAMTSRILAGEYHFPPTPVVSPAARDLISRLLDVNPERRLRVAGIMNHSWTFESDDAAGVAAARRFNNDLLHSQNEDLEFIAATKARLAQADRVFRALGWERPAGI